MVDKYPKDQLEILYQWGANQEISEIIIDCIRNKRNILVAADMGRGKTLLLKELISMTAQEEKFAYVGRGAITEYEIYPSDLVRLATTLDLSTKSFYYSSNPLKQACKNHFFVIDDVQREHMINIVEYLKDLSMQGTIASCLHLKGHDENLILDLQVKYFDLIIHLEEYQLIKEISLLGRY
ncbi:hypothetical protein [Paenibacillus sp. Leaf72]|uniref:hypothetical protein n=1 Tax=Paenibacillus sp. Leaf72 TaxID=1736234 RepID=UPI0012DDFED9|nr:hypothetical protein [Paenibacillus sp. Leaf72]